MRGPEPETNSSTHSPDAQTLELTVADPVAPKDCATLRCLPRVISVLFTSLRSATVNQDSQPVFTGKLFLDQRVAGVDAVVLDPAGHFGAALTRHVTETGNRLRFAEVQNQPVRMIRRGVRPLRVPEIRRLAVNRVLRRAVRAHVFLAVHIGNCPAVVADGVAVGVEQIQFGHGGVRLAVQRVQGFEAEELSAGGRREFYVLRVRSRREGAGVNRFGGGQIQLHRRSARFQEIQFRPELIQNRLCQSGNFRLLRAGQIQDDNFIFARAQPAAGRVGGLRRADVPVTTEAMAVHPQIALAPAAQIQKRVAGLFQIERAAPERWLIADCRLPIADFSLSLVTSAAAKFQSGQHFVVQRQIENFPALQNFAAEFHRGDEPFPVGHFHAEIHAARRLDEDVELRRGLAFGQQNFRARVAPVKHADAFAIEKNVAEIVDGRRFERRRRARRNLGAIQNAAVALIVGFHVARYLVRHRRRKIVEDRRGFRQRHRREGDDGIGRGHFGQFFAGQKIFGEQLARLEKFRRGPAGFADGRVVIIAGRVRLERPVAAGPQAERRAAVRHVNAE